MFSITRLSKLTNQSPPFLILRLSLAAGQDSEPFLDPAAGLWMQHHLIPMLPVPRYDVRVALSLPGADPIGQHLSAIGIGHFEDLQPALVLRQYPPLPMVAAAFLMQKPGEVESRIVSIRWLVVSGLVLDFPEASIASIKSDARRETTHPAGTCASRGRCLAR